MLIRNIAVLVGLIFGWVVFSLLSLGLVLLAHAVFGLLGLGASVIALFLLASALADRLL